MNSFLLNWNCVWRVLHKTSKKAFCSYVLYFLSTGGQKPERFMRVCTGLYPFNNKHNKLYRLCAVRVLSLCTWRRGRFRPTSLWLYDGRGLHETMAVSDFFVVVCALPVALSTVEMVPLLRRPVWHLWGQAQCVIIDERCSICYGCEHFFLIRSLSGMQQHEGGRLLFCFVCSDLTKDCCCRNARIVKRKKTVFICWFFFV